MTVIWIKSFTGYTKIMPFLALRFLKKILLETFYFPWNISQTNRIQTFQTSFRPCTLFFPVHCSSWNCTSKNNCPKIIQVAWWDVAPYIYLDSVNNHSGIFSKVIEKVVAQCCGTCSSLQYRKSNSNSEDLKKRIGEFGDQFFTCF